MKNNKTEFVLSISLFTFIYVLGKRWTLQKIKIVIRLVIKQNIWA